MVRAYPSFRSVKHAQEYCYSPLDGMLFHRRVTPSSISPVPIYTPGWRESKWIRVFLVWGNNATGEAWTPGLQIQSSRCQPLGHTRLHWGKKILTNFPLDIVYDQALQSIYIYMTFYMNNVIILVWTNGQTCKDSWYHNQCFSYSCQGNQHHHPVSLLS